MTIRPYVSATDGVPSPTTFPENTLGSGLKRLTRLRTRNPITAPSTVTHSAA